MITTTRPFCCRMRAGLAPARILAIIVTSARPSPFAHCLAARPTFAKAFFPNRHFSFRGGESGELHSFPRGGSEDSETEEMESDKSRVDPDGEGLHAYVEGLNFEGTRETGRNYIGGDPLLQDPALAMRASESQAGTEKYGSRHADPEGECLHDYIDGLNFDGNLEAELFAEGADPFHLFDSGDVAKEEGTVETESFDGDEGHETDPPSLANLFGLAPMPGFDDVVGLGGTKEVLEEAEVNDNYAFILPGADEQVEVTAENTGDVWNSRDGFFDYD